jgi:hypothetical protein
VFVIAGGKVCRHSKFKKFSHSSFATARAALFSAASYLIDRGPCALFRFLGAHAAIFIALFNVFGHALLLVRVTRFVASWHKNSIRPVAASFAGKMENQRHQKQNQKNKEQDLRYSHCRPGNAGEAQHACDQRNDQKNESIST